MNPDSLLQTLGYYLFWDPMIRLEAVLAFTLLVLSFSFQKRRLLFHKIDALAAKWGTRKAPAMISIFAATLLLHAGVSLLRPERHPSVHDEFSYLLSADTFLHGRLSNPPHPMWEHFETVHVLSQPTYSSMYPPLQGLVLAGGEIVAGNYLAGPWICSAILCALIYWMLSAWVRRRWAFLGALLCVFRIGFLSYWANSYWGGTIAAIGGALLLGAIPEVVKRPKMFQAVPLSLGLLILAGSRPFEGLLFALGLAILMIFLFRQTKASSIKRSLSVTVPLCLTILIPGFLALGCYNKQVTGNWMRMPQQENMAAYGLAILPWQSIHAERIPRADHLKAFYKVQRDRFQNFFTARGFIKGNLKALSRFWCFFVCPLFSLPLLFLLYHWRKRRYFRLLFPGLIFALALIINPNFFPHYFAPAFGLYWLWIIMGLRILHGFHMKNSRNKPFLFFVRAIPLCIILVAASSVWGIASGRMKPPGSDYVYTWHYTGAGNTRRAGLISRLTELGGKHLVLVQYAPTRNVLSDWVYNAADIDGSNIVFAHDLGSPFNERLFEYYTDRQIWTINIDVSPQELHKLRDAKDKAGS